MERLVYPVIISEMHDDGRYYVVTSPNIPGLVAQSKYFLEAAYFATNAMSTMLDDEEVYPAMQDPSNWQLKDNECIIYVAFLK